MGTIILKLLWESLSVLLGKLAVAVVSERFMSRMAAKCIRGLSKLDSNKFSNEDAEALIELMQRTDLPKLK